LAAAAAALHECRHCDWLVVRGLRVPVLLQVQGRWYVYIAGKIGMRTNAWYPLVASFIYYLTFKLQYTSKQDSRH
jgi:hypothetical protein